MLNISSDMRTVNTDYSVYNMNYYSRPTASLQFVFNCAYMYSFLNVLPRQNVMSSYSGLCAHVYVCVLVNVCRILISITQQTAR